jgi:hypothetical protein
LIEDLLAAGGEKMAAGSVEGSKSEAFRKLAKRPVADYFQEGHFEVRKLGETAAKVPALAPDELTKLTNDVHLYTDLMIDQLARKKARNALDPSGEEFLEVLQRLKAFQRKKTNSWAAQRIADKFSLLAVAGKRSGLTFQDLFDALVSDFLVEDGRLAPKTFAESWQNVKKKFRPQNRRRMRREMIDFIKDRAAKTYAAHILVFPATVGLGLGYANICAHYQWNCPLTTLEPAVKEDKLWKSKRKKVIEQKEALEKEIGAIEKQIEGGESAASVYGSTRKKLKDAGKKMRDRLQHMAQKNTKLKDLLVNQLSEWNTVFSTAKQELIFAQKSGDQAQITAARQEYSSALATLLNAELFMPALVTSPITDEDRSLKNIDDAATFQKKTLELLKAYQESIDKIIQQMDGMAPAATQP